MSEHDSPNWTAVGEAMAKRRKSEKLTQEDLHDAAHVSVSVIAELERGIPRKRRSPGTLERLSSALGWPRNHLDDILNRRATQASAAENLTPAEQALRSIGERLDNVDKKLDTVLAQQRDILWRLPRSSGMGIELAGSGHDQADHDRGDRGEGGQAVQDADAGAG